MRRVQFTARGQCPQDDGRTGHGDDTAEEDRRAGRQPEPQGHPCRGRPREGDLQSPAQHDGLPQMAQPVEREFQADPEQQEHDADLGQDLDLMDIVDEAEACRPDQDPGQDKPGNRGKAHALQEADHHYRNPKHDDQVLEKGDVRHTRSVAEIAASPARTGGVSL